MNFFFLVITFSIAMWFLSPRFFLFMDQRVAKQHLAHSASPQMQKNLNAISPRTPRIIDHVVKRGKQSSSRVLPEYAQCLESLARATRSHQPSRDALIASLSLLPTTPVCTQVVNHLRNGEAILDSLSPQDCNQHEQQFFEFLRVSLVQNVFIPQALEQAADLIREEVRFHQDLTTATAQARSSASLLTSLPFIVLALFLISSSTVRQGMFSILFILTIGIGITINRLGWWWIQRLAHNSAIHTTDLASSLAQRLCVSLRAGLSLRTAVETWAQESEPSLHKNLLRGEPLSTALQEFAHRHSGNSHHLVQVLQEADRDGLPVIHTITRLSLEMRTHRRHQTDIRIRQLPTKLTLPIVLCVLPSFIFLTVIPIVLANLSQFTLSPPPIPNIS